MKKKSRNRKFFWPITHLIEGRLRMQSFIMIGPPISEKSVPDTHTDKRSLLLGWSIIKTLAEIIIGISSIITNGLNYQFAFCLWFIRLFGLIGVLLSLNEVLLVRFIVKGLLKKSVLMNDSLISTWIKISNLVVAFGYTLAQSKSNIFQRSVVHLVSNEYI